ncbi:hypothetical protein [Streptomyces exfoliatus]|uniref:hypothetical protein n=1 Tax=Streptomyces exfoliatus TaxID=1905 RepID=UPI000464D324|nr:hypothetical protein [Streptomyces exfoliatus]
MSLGDEHDGFGGVGGSGQTRTRLPEGNSGDVYGGARRPVRNSRSLITVVGVVVLLIAAIAFANRGGGDPADAAPTAGTPGEQAPTAATGIRPVKGRNGEIPMGFARDEQGAQSAASNYAVALGSDGMFKRVGRHRIVDTVYTPEAAARLKGPQDEAYSAEFLKKLGLDAEGNPPAGNTFVSRTIPVGAKVENFDGDTAKVSVWYTGLIGMSGPDSTDPVSTTWMTWTFDLRWKNNDWKVADDSQKRGPAPVPGDVTASTADEISKAVEEFGGFTYAR